LGELYRQTLLSWGRKIFREPHQWLLISLAFAILAVPVISFGVAAAVAVWLARRYSLEYEVHLIKEAKGILRLCLWKAAGMGLLDIVFAMAFIGSIFHMISTGKILWSYMLFAILDFFYLLSGYYRYPILVCNSDLTVWRILVTGMMLATNNFGLLLLLFSVNALVAIISVFSGLGILLVYPGVTAFMSIYLYRISLQKYVNQI
jgi:hypothetical protein